MKKMKQEDLSEPLYNARRGNPNRLCTLVFGKRAHGMGGTAADQGGEGIEKKKLMGYV